MKNKNIITQESAKKLAVTQIKSSIGKKYDQRQTLIGLGLNKINRKVIVDLTPSIEGMIRKIKHLLKVENIN